MRAAYPRYAPALLLALTLSVVALGHSHGIVKQRTCEVGLYGRAILVVVSKDLRWLIDKRRRLRKITVGRVVHGGLR